VRVEKIRQWCKGEVYLDGPTYEDMETLLAALDAAQATVAQLLQENADLDCARRVRLDLQAQVTRLTEERDNAIKAHGTRLKELAARQVWIDEYAKQTKAAIQQRDEAWAEFDALREERDRLARHVRHQGDLIGCSCGLTHEALAALLKEES